MKANFKALIFLAVATAFVGTATQDVKFERKTIKIDKVDITVEMAESFEQQRRGLMFRKSLSENEGMLFVYEKEQILSFWMKNTFIPLSIGFFNAKGVLVDIQDMEPVKSEMEVNLPSYYSKKPAKYALEVPKGWFSRHKIKPGARLKL